VFRLLFLTLFLAASGLALNVHTASGSSNRMHTLEHQELISYKGFLPSRINRLKAERDELKHQIAQLPQHHPKPLSERLGYHSVPVAERFRNKGGMQHIDVKFAFYSMLDSIALMPAIFNGDAGVESYAFPKRFKIDVLEKRGRWISGKDGEEGHWDENRDKAEWIEVVNWMDMDFPDPGPYPVFFECDGQQVYQIRITFPDDGNGREGEFHALGEIYIFRRDANEQISDNMMGWGDDVEVKASNALSKPPLWDVQYLKDGYAGLGLPLSEEKNDADDLMVSWESEAPDAPVQITLDLGEVRQVGGVYFWPAEAPYGMAVPLFGFPGKVEVELSADVSFTNIRKATVSNARERMPRDNLLIIATRAYDARYVRVTLDDFPEYQQRKILGLGEIQVVEYNDVWSTGCTLTAAGLPEQSIIHLPRLVDGVSRHRRILSESERIKGLAQRRPLDRRLVVVERELVLAENAWHTLQLRLSVAGGGLLLLVLFLGWRGQQRQRRRELSKLRQRITSDLHDEVGSSLGGISLMSEDLEKMAVNQTVKEELGELTLMAREACSSLREVVWMTDEDVILLPALIEKLMERAERTLRGVELHLESSTEFPEVEVALNFKRHLIMFFREAVHNCARHSKASEVTVSVKTVGKMLEVLVQDNGCGFELSARRSGWGLASMNKRAKELGGQLELHSVPDEGTRVILTVPIETVSREPERAYQTSNKSAKN
jgi:signal transduction histidine kinase